MSIYLIAVCILMALAVMGLIVGVSNDATNFLNSAIGSKAAPRWVILLVASVGIMLGAISANGMMEVARSGIFSPAEFVFAEVMIMFLAVMFTNVILLDLYNTFGLPTSTTVALVFSLLGAAVAVGIVKIFSIPDIAIGDIGKYIKSGRVLGIISGILISVAIAFTIGTIVQFITRLLFSFRYKRMMKYFGGIWAGMAITAITYFIIIKGIGESSLKDGAIDIYIKEHTGIILTYSLLFWTLLLQLCIWLFEVNVLKFVVLVGTFSLALAFAGNDLVNFIGVPMAGLSSYEAFMAADIGADAKTFTMEALNNPVDTKYYYLVIAGAIMTLTLWFSKKSRTVTETEVSLARQNSDTGVEKFGSTMLSRAIVRATLNASNSVNKVIPDKALEFIDKRFTPKKVPSKDAPSFDLLRASVNLTLSSILIALGTSLKLPLSTTYVTFMVAMGSSLSDRAWGRDSAVYRITGVLTVISGWFLTALIAFVIAITVALVLYFGETGGVIGMTILAAILIVRSNVMHTKKVEERKPLPAIDSENIVQHCIENVEQTLKNVVSIYSDTIVGLTNEDRKLLKSVKQQVEELKFEARELESNVYNVLRKLQKDQYATGHFYVMVIDYLREVAYALNFMTEPGYTHIENNHKGLSTIQASELLNVNNAISKMFASMHVMIQKNDYSELPELLQEQQGISEMLSDARKNQVKRIKEEQSGTRNSILYLGLINESKNLMIQSINLLKALRDFSGQN
ncbi:MAG: inorganic phosphate transporter [Prevotellaceae bacterium]|jgi:phosphate/sulfate permease|nr:inorganic phosphate transporter [Prevotellaceae bacterium]